MQSRREAQKDVKYANQVWVKLYTVSIFNIFSQLHRLTEALLVASSRLFKFIVGIHFPFCM